MIRRKAWRAYMLMVSILVTFILSAYFTPADAEPIKAVSLCGNGSAPDYGLNYDLQQLHWTVGWENYASEGTVNEVDTVLDRLNEDSIAQTMILILPQEQVGIRPNCAVHFLRYMRLGLPSGERKDNGFVFLIVVQPESIDVHYAVGLGLPALAAYELTSINRAAEAAYESTNSMDQALLTLVQQFDTVARDNYVPLISPTPTPEPLNLPSGPVGLATICGELCIGMFFLFFILWAFNQMGRGGVSFGPSGSRSWGRGFPSGGGSSGSSTRGGSGSGRSGRTN